MRVSQPARSARSSAPARRSGSCLGRAPSASRTARRRRPAQQRGEQLDRCRIGPVDVVEHEHERRRRCDALEQLAHGPVGAVALVLSARARSPAPSPAWRGTSAPARCAGRRRATRGVAARARRRTPRARRRRSRTAGRPPAPMRSRTARGARARRHGRPARRAAVLPIPGSPTSRSPRPAPRERRGAVQRAELLGAPDEVRSDRHLGPGASITERAELRSTGRPM